MMLLIALLGCDSDHGALNEAKLPPDLCLKYYKLADEALNIQQFNIAESNYIQAFRESEKQGLRYGLDYRVLSDIYTEEGRYDEAISARMKAIQLSKDQMSLGDIDMHYCYLGDIYLAQGKYQLALDNFNLSHKSAEKTMRLERDKSGFIYLAPHFGNYYIQQAEYGKAILYLKQRLDWLLKNSLMSMRIAQAKNGLAMAYYYAGNDVDAEKLFRESAGLNANAMVGFPTDLAQSLTMLGRIAEHRGEGDKALKFYESARKSLHMYRPFINKVDDADICNQIGRYYVKQGKSEEAAKAYHEAIAFRRETATQTHPNCADAIKGLADVAAFKNELTTATLQAQAALKILDASVVPTHPRLAPELVALASLDILAGHPEQAAPLNARLETILQKPLGPWKEDFLETTAFYAGLLKKAGKSAEAGKLEALQARQKDRR